MEAKGLKAMDGVFGKNDVFCVFSTGAQHIRSSTKFNSGASATWKNDEGESEARPLDPLQPAIK